MDHELIAYLDKQFREAARQIEGLREENNRRFERVQEGIRQLQAIANELQRESQLGAEHLESFNEELDEFRANVAWETCETRRVVRRSLAALNGRVRSMELWRELKERDPIDVIRERFGLGKKRTPPS